ncbi:MAG: indole-3-glycerol phosphate synthase TrpC [Candidatus Omnitrophica bacterium]|nr:indole-3-glycerol phosphate synthase TrpC [Candidatus Omnitrophota bacterium]MCF7893982.1 indole-3-glycerol phosphate synthase TrpC [Candidatus Omnitrophota bacterium]
MHKVLSLIVESKKKRIRILKRNKEALVSLAEKSGEVNSFKEAIERKNKISLIAEMKQASPSKGILQKDFSPTRIARIFDSQKVNAISVITEEDFFLGKNSYIQEVKRETTKPVLKKDFILDKIQIIEAKAIGADAILLIMGILEFEQAKELYEFAKSLNLDVLTEVSTEKELRKALKMGADIIGVNNRNLHTLEININRSKKLLPFIPEGVVQVSESGINSLKDVLLLKGLGVDAILVGHAFMEADNIEEKIKELHIDA